MRHMKALLLRQVHYYTLQPRSVQNSHTRGFYGPQCAIDDPLNAACSRGVLSSKRDKSKMLSTEDMLRRTVGSQIVIHPLPNCLVRPQGAKSR
jgi:hypothetical protein